MTDNELDDIMEQMMNLRQQATTEKSHYYTEKVLNLAIIAITDLRLSVKVLRHLGEGSREVIEDLERDLKVARALQPLPGETVVVYPTASKTPLDTL